VNVHDDDRPVMNWRLLTIVVILTQTGPAIVPIGNYSPQAPFGNISGIDPFKESKSAFRIAASWSSSPEIAIFQRKLARPTGFPSVPEILVEDRHAGPAETAASRIDFAAWLRSLSHPKRRLAVTLGAGESTSAVARKFHVSLGRVPQLRRELKQAWEVFAAEHPAANTVSAV
jgi:hypothetical protein